VEKNIWSSSGGYYFQTYELQLIVTPCIDEDTNGWCLGGPVAFIKASRLCGIDLVIESSTTIGGVTLAVAETDAFKTAFQGSIAKQYDIIGSDVTVGTILEARRRLSSGVVIPFTIKTTGATAAQALKDVAIDTTSLQESIVAEYTGLENLGELTVEGMEALQDIHPKCSTLMCTDGTHSAIAGDPSCASYFCVQDEAACCTENPKCATLPCTDGTHSSILGEPSCAAAVCVQDEVACCAENVDCVGAWSTCAADCFDKIFTVSTAASGSGQECSESDGATSICSIGDGDCVETVDCVGAWSTCAVDCGDKTFAVSIAASGIGQGCSESDGATAVCNIGDGDCVETVDCVGAWSACAADCGDKAFTVSTAVSGIGQECSESDGATAICNIGDGNCSGDCIGAWSTCAVDCGDKAFTISTAVSGSGQECSESDGATAICNIGDDDCSGAATSVCSFSAMLVAMLGYSIM